MARYRIAYLDGETETVNADLLEYVGGHYVGYRANEVIAYIPSDNVRSVVRQDDTKAVDA